jgi:hypothetical protein
MTLFFGCSDDREPVPDSGVPADAAKDAGASADVVKDVSLVDATGPDGYIDLFDVIPLPDSGCPGCIKDRCGNQINSCFNNPACAAGVFCTLQMCAGGLLGDSGFNPANISCVLGCFNGDQNLAFMALSSLTCLTMTCGPACGLVVDAGSDARPPNPDVQTPPDATADAPPEDAKDDATAPDTGPGNDSGENDADGVPPSDDAADDTPGNDATPDTGNPTDAPSSDSATPEDATDDAQPDAGAD